MDVPKLRDGSDGSGEPKMVMDTKMLNTEARETPDTVSAVNTNMEFTKDSPKFGKLGAQGRE